jgi:hypothetical protein
MTIDARILFSSTLDTQVCCGACAKVGSRGSIEWMLLGYPVVNAHGALANFNQCDAAVEIDPRPTNSLPTRPHPKTLGLRDLIH